MHSIKPGRGPSMMGAIGGLAVAGFGVIWTIGASSMGAPGFFVLFGVGFIVIALGGAAYNFYNATQKNRLSSFDITRGSEEPDPFAQALGHEPRESQRRPTHGPAPKGSSRKFEGNFCPFCGAEARAEFDYCPNCGKDI